MTAIRDRPSFHLTRHFFGALFDLGFLSDAGIVSFTRVIIGVCAVFLSFGLLLTRVFATKYVNLAASRTPEPYRQALLADHAFLIAIPMWIAAFVTVLVGHALFPDATDVRILMPLPVTRRLVFGAKTIAVALFAGVFIGSAHAALSPLFLLTTFSRWAEGALLLRAGAYLAASLLGSVFTMLAIAAVHGLFVVWAPAGRVPSASAWLRSLMICALVLSLPLVGRLPAEAAAFSAGSPWLYSTPPAWFLGVERWLLGDSRSHILRLSQIAAGSLGLAAAITFSSYAALYLHVDRLIVRPQERAAGPFKPPNAIRPRRTRLHPVAKATRAFTSLTLRRSVLHQGVLVGLGAIGLGLVANSFLSAGLPSWIPSRSQPAPRILESMFWAPFALSYIAARAVRAALVIPMEQRANWIFRLTHRDAWRIEQLGAAPHLVWRIGVAAPVCLLCPLLLVALGRTAIVVAMVTLLCGRLLVELLMSSWDRIPFTCSYLPGKKFVPQAILTSVSLFVLFTTAGAFLARASVEGRPFAWVVNMLVAIGAIQLRRTRLATWFRTPVQFEDTLPAEVNPLKLSRN